MSDNKIIYDLNKNRKPIKISIETVDIKSGKIENNLTIDLHFQKSREFLTRHLLWALSNCKRVTIVNKLDNKDHT